MLEVSKMSNAAIRDAVAAATTYLSQHPAEARYTDSKAAAVLDSGLMVSVTGPDGAVVRTDMPTSVGGGGSGPSPGWLLRAAQASCLATLISMRAAQEGLSPGRIGSPLIASLMTAGFSALTIRSRRGH